MGIFFYEAGAFMLWLAGWLNCCFDQSGCVILICAKGCVIFAVNLGEIRLLRNNSTFQCFEVSLKVFKPGYSKMAITGYPGYMQQLYSTYIHNPGYSTHNLGNTPILILLYPDSTENALVLIFSIKEL